MRRTTAALAIITAASLPAALAVGLPSASASQAGYDVFVGYADNQRANPQAFPTPFDTGPGVTNVGDPSSAPLDSGAVRLTNTTGTTETVNSVVVHVGSASFDIWPHNVPLGSFDQLVLDQVNGFNFDSSDVPSENCTPDGIIPEVDVTVDGVMTPYFDTGQVLNTGGIDPPVCNGGNESQQWVSIGSPPCPTGATLTLSPAAQSDQVGSNAVVRANFSSCGTPLQGAVVDFSVVSGPNAGLTGSGTVDASGNATFTYSSSVAGSDTVSASVTNGAGSILSNTVTVTWLAAVLSGRAFGLSLGGLVTVKPTPDTGPVFTTSSSTVGPPCVVHIGTLTSPVKANALCASVVTSAAYPAKSTAGAGIASATIAVPNLPVIQIGAVQSASTTSCAGSAGSASIVSLKVGNTVVITRQIPRPNYTVTVGVLTIVMNQQIPFNTQGDRGLTVNAIHITGLNGAINLIVASATSDIGNCP